MNEPIGPLVDRLDLIARLLTMQNRLQIDGLRDKIVKTSPQKKLYAALDGDRKIEELAKVCKMSVDNIKHTLPEWERRGLIVGMGKGKGKRYVTIENLEL